MRLKERNQRKLPPRTSVVIKPEARRQANELAAHAKRSFSKEVEYLIEQEYARLLAAGANGKAKE